jgi:glycosyltransferase involved in cell wall biosynthesis
MKELETKITIGIPVYNGENTIKRVLDSVLAQTYTNYEIIISDNGSTDSTAEICSQYKESDKRIKYIRKNKTVSWIWNFISLLDKAETEYFVWIAADDYWDPKFVEKNLEVLESNKNIVGSISDVKLVGNNIKKYYSNPNDYNPNSSKWEFVRPNIGSYEKKVQNIFEFNWIINVHSVFRTEFLKKSIIRKAFVSWDFAIMLKILEFGDLYVLDEVLMFRDTGGISSTKSQIELLKKQNFSWFGTYFPYITYTIFSVRILGLRIFLKHISHFKYLNIHTAKKIIRELFSKKSN